MAAHVLTKREIVATLKAEGLRPSRRRGQNFLIDGNLLRLVADAPALSPDDVVLEIGAGLGQLSRLLAERAGHVVTVELDAGLARLLRTLLADFPNVTLLEADAMASPHAVNPAVVKALEGAMAGRRASDFRVVANPPYTIATPFLLTCLTEGPRPRDFHLTLQEELAERLSGGPGSKDYGPATVMAQALAQVSVLHRLGASTFWPAPRVGSALVRVVPDAALAGRIRDLATFRRTVAALFQARRKTVRNAIRRLFHARQAAREGGVGDLDDRVPDPFFPCHLLEKTGIDPGLRPDALAVEQFIALANAAVPSAP